jgi:hypothetical protein
MNPYVHFHVHKSHPTVSVLSQINAVHTTPSYLRSISVLSSQLRLGLPRGLLPSGFPTKTRYALLFSLMHATHPVHLLLNFIYLYLVKGGNYEAPLIMQFSPASYHFISLRSKFHTHKKPQQNYNSVYFNFYVFRQKREDKRYWTEWQQILPAFYLCLISSWIKFPFLTAVPKYFNWATFAKNLRISYLHVIIFSLHSCERHQHTRRHVGPLSERHGASSCCGWRRRHPEMKGKR